MFKEYFVGLLCLVQERFQWWALVAAVNTATKPYGDMKTGHVLTS
jgi:hypothetical protein